MCPADFWLALSLEVGSVSPRPDAWLLGGYLSPQLRRKLKQEENKFKAGLGGLHSEVKASPANLVGPNCKIKCK